LQNPSWFPASSGNHEGFCKCLVGFNEYFLREGMI